jgi:hypothetical protein
MCSSRFEQTDRMFECTVQYVNLGGIFARERKNPSTGARGGGRMGGGE